MVRLPLSGSSLPVVPTLITVPQGKSETGELVLNAGLAHGVTGMIGAPAANAVAGTELMQGTSPLPLHTILEWTPPTEHAGQVALAENDGADPALNAGSESASSQVPPSAPVDMSVDEVLARLPVFSAPAQQAYATAAMPSEATRHHAPNSSASPKFCSSRTSMWLAARRGETQMNQAINSFEVFGASLAAVW